jgi:hypothetical protein
MGEKILFKADTLYTKEKMIQYFKSKFTIGAYFGEFILCLCGCILLLE